MNLILLFPSDFSDEGVARLGGRRRDHILRVHRAGVGDELVVGLAGGQIGRGVVRSVDGEAIELAVLLDRPPPPPAGITLVLALPRPKVMNRVVAAVASLGIKKLFLVNSWRVDKSYWKSPRLEPENLRHQSILGLEQARDTVMPQIELRRLFRPFVEEELPAIAQGTLALVAHPYAEDDCPRHESGPVTLAIGPEGGFIEQEIGSLQLAGFRPVRLGTRILRVETAVAALAGRLK
jgi:16S rRNA (uracil1498-N3)-methyltransferase